LQLSCRDLHAIARTCASVHELACFARMCASVHGLACFARTCASVHGSACCCPDVCFCARVCIPLPGRALLCTGLHALPERALLSTGLHAVARTCASVHGSAYHCPDVRFCARACMLLPGCVLLCERVQRLSLMVKSLARHWQCRGLDSRRGPNYPGGLERPSVRLLVHCCCSNHRSRYPPVVSQTYGMAHGRTTQSGSRGKQATDS